MASFQIAIPSNNPFGSADDFFPIRDFVRAIAAALKATGDGFVLGLRLCTKDLYQQLDDEQHWYDLESLLIVDVHLCAPEFGTKTLSHLFKLFPFLLKGLDGFECPHFTLMTEDGETMPMTWNGRALRVE